MAKFLSELIVKKIDARSWMLYTPFEYRVGHKDSDEVIKVPREFLTDFASIPRIFWTVLPPDGKYTGAAVIHDYLYSLRGELPKRRYTRKRCDQIFLEAMEVLDVSLWRRSTIYRCVRLFGWIPW